MSLDVVVFKAIDYLFDLFQNRSSMVRKSKKKIDIEKNIEYMDIGDKNTTSLDLYLPKTRQDKKLPVVFVIHGGGFVAGDKKYRRGLSLWLSENANCAVVNVNYGLGPKYLFPEPIIHLANAANWVYDNAEKYNFNLDKVLVTGDSAGGYYAAQLCAIQNSSEMQNKYGVQLKTKFSAIALNCGIYDMDTALSQKVLFNLTDSLCFSFLGIKKDNIKDYEYYNYMSPLKYVDEKFPKAFVVYAKKDFFCGGQGEAILEKLKTHNVEHVEYHSEKFMDNHTFPSTWKSKAAKEANKLMLDFIVNFFEE